MGDWQYLTEGGKHVVFKNIRNTGKFVGKVLRVRKCMNCSNTLKNASATASSFEFLSDYDYNVNRILYADSSDLLCQPLLYKLDKDVLVKLAEIAEVKRRPKYKGKHLWDSTLQSWDETSELWGEILPNMFLMHSFHDASQNSWHNGGAESKHIVERKVLTLELKIKGAFPSISPFLSNTLSQVKRQYGRYQLKQLAKSAGISKEASGTIHDPMDLFSMDATRIRSSLRDLTRFSTTILRAFVDGVEISNIEESDVYSPTSRWASLSGTFLPNNLEYSANQAIVVEIMATLLLQCTFLKELSAAQKLDLVDVEGAAMIFDRLVSLVGDSREAENKLCESVTLMKPLLEDLRQCIYSSDDTGIPSLHFTSDKIPHFIKDLIDLQSSPAALDSYVTNLSCHECCVLLNLWLISLAAKDTSLMASFEVVKSSIQSSKCVIFEEAGKQVPAPLSSSQFSCIELACPPTCEHCSSNDPSKLVLRYFSVLIDTGYKDPSKCWSKVDEERRMCEALSLLSSTVL